MAYVALYRKYRSQSFGELMGQDAVTTTIQNALRSGRIAHAYLFHGARGCGKTSTARLLARALNCVAGEGPTPEPCGVCRLCVAIREGSCLDVIEMDAASETGIDDVREKIIENVQYAPGEGRYKVYIIDEVHDLSAKAFDALLKTLEEPPPHVVFVLATTELHKVPITIRSRCQPFQFKRGTVQDLSAAIQRVIDAEEYTAEPEAVQSIARSAEGSWRDALSLLEQVMAYSDRRVTAEVVQRALGTVGSDTLMRVTNTIARGCWDEVLAVAGELIDSGKDARQLITALAGHLRELMLISAGAAQAAALELGADRVTLLAPIAARFEPPLLLEMMGELAAAEREIRFTNQHRWLLERTLLRLVALRETGAQSRRASAPAPERASAPAPAAQAPTPQPPPASPRPAVEPPPAPAAAPRSTAPPTYAEPAPQTTPADGGERFATPITLDVVRRSWAGILRAVSQVSPQGAVFLEHGVVQSLDGRLITLNFTNQLARDRIHNKGREVVEKKINQLLNSEGYRINCVLTTAATAEAPTALSTEAAPAGLMEVPADVPKPAVSAMDMYLPAAEPAVRPPAEPVTRGAENGLLNETLAVMGGEVVHSEPIDSKTK